METRIEPTVELSKFIAKQEASQKAKDLRTLAETTIEGLYKKLDITPSSVVGFRLESHNLNAVADMLEQFAKEKEKDNKKQIRSEDVKEIKQVLLESLGLSAAYVDILLQSANPDEIRNVASTIRKEAEKKLELAEETNTQYKAQILKDINNARTYMEQLNENHVDINSYEYQAYQRLVNKADEELRLMLQQQDRYLEQQKGIAGTNG